MTALHHESSSVVNRSRSASERGSAASLSDAAASVAPSPLAALSPARLEDAPLLVSHADDAMVEIELPSASLSSVSVAAAISSSSSSSLQRVTLERRLTMWDGLSVTMGIMIGSGIFASPGLVLERVNGSVALSLVVWVFGGVLVSLGGLCYAELGAAMSSTGGDYVFLERIIGAPLAFVYVWLVFFVLKTGSQAIISLIFARYFVAVLLGYSPASSELDDTLIVKVFASGTIVLISALNCVSVRFSAALQRTTMIGKIAAVALILLFALIFVIRDRATVLHENFSQSFSNTPSSSQLFGAVGMSMIAALWSYDGWADLVQLGEEMQNPQRNVPFCILVGIGVVTILYSLVNVAYLCVLPATEVMTSHAVAIRVGEKAANRFGEIVMPLFICLGTLGSLNGSTMTGGRVIYAAAVDGNFPFSSYVGRLSARFRTPHVSLIVQAVWAVILTIPGNFAQLTSYFGMCSWLFYSLVVVAMIIYRYRSPDTPRPFRVRPFPLVPILFIFVGLAIVVSAIIESWLTSTLVLLFTLTGACVYFVFFYRNGLVAKKVWQRMKF